MLFGSLLFVLSCNDAQHPKISLAEALTKIQSGKIDQVEALGESTLILTERKTNKTFQADIDGQFDRVEAIAGNAHVEGIIGAYEFQPIAPDHSTRYFLLFGALLFGLIIFFRLLNRKK